MKRTRYFILFSLSYQAASAQDSGTSVAHRDGDEWGKPVNLGPPVNSPLNEYFSLLRKITVQQLAAKIMTSI